MPAPISCPDCCVGKDSEAEWDILFGGVIVCKEGGSVICQPWLDLAVLTPARVSDAARGLVKRRFLGPFPELLIQEDRTGPQNFHF